MLWEAFIMAIELNHTIVHAKDRQVSAEFLTHILGLKLGSAWGPFLPVPLSNDITLDFISNPDKEVVPQHYAFLVSEEEFDEIFPRIQDTGDTYWADPARKLPNEINRNDGGRGVYFLDPDGHYLEVFTRPYGSGSA
jgi:catechol 2,3-dioxygenase-like lactoylglutathione lyase family enzyme